MYIGDKVREEIGDGYSVGPGHGLIVSKVGDNIRVNSLSIIIIINLIIKQTK